VQIKPIISTMSADQKLRDLQAMVDQLTKQHEVDEKRIRELEEAVKILEDEKRRLLEQLKARMTYCLLCCAVACDQV
jgi:predicted nuclease with TOPRIM domain